MWALMVSSIVAIFITSDQSSLRRISFLTLLLFSIQPIDAFSEAKLIMNPEMKKACPKGVLSVDELFEPGAIHEEKGISFQDSPKIKFTKECFDIRIKCKLSG